MLGSGRRGLSIAGISANFHDAACCILVDGELIAAAQEERFSRIKHDASIPKQAFQYCLQTAGLTIDRLDCVAFYENPKKKLARQIWSGQIHTAVGDPFRFSATRPEAQIRDILGFQGRIIFVDHHHSHAGSSFFYSGFDEAAILTIDSVGEWATTTYGHGQGTAIKVFEEVHFPHSLGLFYSAITNYLGFAVNDGECKVMGLAPYGNPVYVPQMLKLLSLGPQGQFHIDTRFFDFGNPRRMYSNRLIELLGRPPRVPQSELSQFHKDVARSLQACLEEALLGKAAYLRKQVPSDNLCLAGGVALNCVANGRLLRSGIFKDIYIPPASGDAGGALGAAAVAYARFTGKFISSRPWKNACVGPAYSASEVHTVLRDAQINAKDFRGDEAALVEAVAERLVNGEIVGWFQGRMEFGPRALGARSILADPRDPTVRDRINQHIKNRESFRPFAPSVLADRASDYFDLDRPSPFMLLVCNVTSREPVPAITHVDGSARVQTVDFQTNPRFAALIRAFERRTGCPMVLNTSFNMQGEPIVRHPAEAVQCFLRSGLDSMALGDFVVDRSDAPPSYWNLASRVPDSSSAISHDVYTFW